MKDRKKQKAKRKINRIIRSWNRSLAEDELWLGRFYIHNYATHIHRYGDNSGTYAYIELVIIDKKTGLYKKGQFNNNELETWKIFNFINNFIVDDVDVWNENPSPRDNNFKKDYRKIRITKFDFD